MSQELPEPPRPSQDGLQEALSKPHPKPPAVDMKTLPPEAFKEVRVNRNNVKQLPLLFLAFPCPTCGGNLSTPPVKQELVERVLSGKETVRGPCALCGAHFELKGSMLAALDGRVGAKPKRWPKKRLL